VRRRADEATAERLLDDVWRLTLPTPYGPRLDVNCYLLARDSGWCLVDCGTALDPGWDALALALEAAGVEPAAIELLVCTHAHPDHYGLAARVLEEAGCELALGPGPLVASETLRDPGVPLEERLELARRAGVPAALAAAATLPPAADGFAPRPEPDRLLRAGDIVASRGCAWRVVPAPGHSPTQILLFDERRRLLIAADLLAVGRLSYLEYGWSEDPWAEYSRALADALALEAEVLLPGHGPPLPRPEARLEACADLIDATPGLVLAQLADEPRSPYEVVERALPPGTSFYVRQMGLACALAVLERLERLGEARSELDGEGILRYRRAVAAASNAR